MSSREIDAELTANGIRAEAAGTSKAPLDAKARAGLRTPALLAILLIFCYIFIRVLPRDPILYDTLTKPFRPSPAEQNERMLAALRAHDPSLGTILPLPSNIEATQSVLTSNGLYTSQAHSRMVMVIMMSTCSG